MNDDLTTGMIKILRAAATRAVQVSWCIVYDGEPGFSHPLGTVNEKDVLFKNGLLEKDGKWSTHYVITDEGRDIIAELDSLVVPSTA